MLFFPGGKSSTVLVGWLLLNNEFVSGVVLELRLKNVEPTCCSNNRKCWW